MFSLEEQWSRPQLPSDIRGHVTLAEGEWLVKMADSKRVLEIGSFRGRSTAFLASKASIVIACDSFCGQKKLLPGQKRLQMEKIERAWHRNMKALGYSRKVWLIKSYSEDLLEALDTMNLRCFGLVFIDGGHDYEIVLKDTNLSRFLEKDGMIAFHDYHSHRFTYVRNAVDLWSQENKSNFIAIEAPDTIGAFKRIE